MNDFLQQFKNIAHNFALGGSPQTDQQLVLSILFALGLDYSSLATAITVRLESISLDELRGLLVNHELLYSQPNLAIDTPPLAHTIQQQAIVNTISQQLLAKSS